LGSLARSLQSTVRCGDIHEEGIVWPRIAEISLLGALGCGKALVQLVVEHLECMKPTAKANYDYVVLQATDNSIPFYESLGFVRVGAIMRDVDEDIENGFVSSSEETYKVTSGETLRSIATKLNVDLWDLLFLNRHIMLAMPNPRIDLFLIPCYWSLHAHAKTTLLRKCQRSSMHIH